MGAAPDVKTVIATLDDLARRARLLKQAQGTYVSWSDVPTFLLVAANMYFFVAARDGISSSTFGLVMAVVIIAGWERRRLGARVDAIVKLLSGASEA